MKKKITFILSLSIIIFIATTYSDISIIKADTPVKCVQCQLQISPPLYRCLWGQESGGKKCEISGDAQDCKLIEVCGEI